MWAILILPSCWWGEPVIDLIEAGIYTTGNEIAFCCEKLRNSKTAHWPTVSRGRVNGGGSALRNSS